MVMTRSTVPVLGSGAILLLALALATNPAGAAGSLAAGPTVQVVEVVDGDTVVLDDGQQVRLVGLQAPKLPLDRPNFVAWPLADEAKAALEELTLGRRVRLSFGGRRIDRHGRLLAHLHDAAERWIQGEMLRRGMARVYSFADNRALVAEMLALERAARARRRGIWSHPYYRVRNPFEAPKYIGSFQLVEGIVRDAAVVKGRAYLNFGEDWRTDFTITLAPRHRRSFEAGGIDPLGYAGRRLRVRGWVKSFNGPMVEATHPEQIEVIEE
jgi:endonuclease YncB( thermonuclease family)